jgi:hypothetical protein
MANPHRGEVSIPGSTHKLRYDVNSICEIEDEYKVSFMDVLNELKSSPKVSDIRNLFWHGLKGAGSKSMSEEDAGAIMTDIGIKASMDLVTEAIRESNMFEMTEEEPEKGEE